MEDVLVVGGGPAGLAAATWAARHRRRVLLVDSGEHRNRWVVTSHGYLGLDSVDPAELRRRARADLLAYPTARLEWARVLGLRREDGRFVATTDHLGDVVALRVVLATGVVDEFPRIDRFLEHYGADVFHCPSCDGFESRDQHVVAIGWSEQMAGFALTLLDWARDVTVVTDGRELAVDEHCHDALVEHGVRVVRDEALRLVGTRGHLRGLELAGGECLPCTRAFFSVAKGGRLDLAVHVGAEVGEDGCLAVDSDGQTRIPGLYAAGDITPGPQLVQIAAAKGTVAGIAAATSLRGEPGAPGSPRPGPDVETLLTPDPPSP